MYCDSAALKRPVCKIVRVCACVCERMGGSVCLLRHCCPLILALVLVRARRHTLSFRESSHSQDTATPPPSPVLLFPTIHSRPRTARCTTSPCHPDTRAHNFNGQKSFFLLIPKQGGECEKKGRKCPGGEQEQPKRLPARKSISGFLRFLMALRMFCAVV